MTAANVIIEDAPVWGDDETAEPIVLPEETEPVAPLLCERCGKTRLYEGVTVCTWCRREEANTKWADSLQATIEEAKRAWDETPWRCVCGEKVLHDGQTCEACQTRESDRRARLSCVQQTVRDLPPRYAWAHFGAPEIAQRVCDGRAIDAAKAAAANEAMKMIVLSGPAGVGKTTLACAALNQIAFNRKVVGAYSDARALSLARSRSPLGEEPELVTTALGCKALVLDDLGLDSAQQHGSCIVDTIYARNAHQLLTIVTLAVPPVELAARYGDGCARRILEADGQTVLIEVQR